MQQQVTRRLIISAINARKFLGAFELIVQQLSDASGSAILYNFSIRMIYDHRGALIYVVMTCEARCCTIRDNTGWLIMTIIAIRWAYAVDLCVNMIYFKGICGNTRMTSLYICDGFMDARMELIINSLALLHPQIIANCQNYPRWKLEIGIMNCFSLEIMAITSFAP